MIDYNCLINAVCSSSCSHAVAGTPTGVTASRTGKNSVLVSWTAPSPLPAGYEVFYQTTAGVSSRLSGGNTSNTELPLNGLTLGKTYYIFVVAFGEVGAPVFPSNHSHYFICKLYAHTVIDINTTNIENAEIFTANTVKISCTVHA